MSPILLLSGIFYLIPEPLPGIFQHTVHTGYNGLDEYGDSTPLACLFFSLQWPQEPGRSSDRENNAYMLSR